VTTIHLGGPLPDRSSYLPGSIGRAARSLLGIAPDEVASRAGHPARWWALTPPFHPYRLPGGLFSVALPAGLPAWALPSVLPCGVPTFLGIPLPG
jgi:hypothetical protein